MYCWAQEAEAQYIVLASESARGFASASQEGQIALFAFPQTDQAEGKLRPALVLRGCPGPHDDWLICMISSQLRHELPGVDAVVRTTDTDFAQTGLKLSSVIRITRLAIVAEDLLQGTIGTLADALLNRIRERLAEWTWL